MFLAETACTLGIVYQTLGEKFDSVSRMLRERIKNRVISDAIDNYLAQNHYWWMGNWDRIDNWNPWISSNILAVSLILLDDVEKLRCLVCKVMQVLDYYADKYPEDGACEEGASYWSQAGLSMLECLWLLKLTSDGKIDFFGEEKVKNTLTYPIKVHTGGNTFINFADCAIHLSVYSASPYKMARLTGKEAVLAFAKEMMTATGMPEGIFAKVFRLTDFMTYHGEMEEAEKSVFTPITDCFFESTQVVVSKSDAEADKAFLLAVKGGHNDECHNHNDVGNFIVYKKGMSFLVDSGNMVYTKETFSANRYNMWTNSSKYHNVPMIDGKVQKYGEALKRNMYSMQSLKKRCVFPLT